MSNAVGDLLMNPNIEGSTAHDQAQAKERKNMLAAVLNRGINEFNKGIAFLPDALFNQIPGVKALGAKDPIETALRSIGSIKDYEPADTVPEKLAESFGGAIGSLAIPGGVGAASSALGTTGKAIGKALLGTSRPLTSVSQLANPTFASTVGGAATQAALQPAIDEKFESPVTQTALGFGAGLLGGGASAAAAGRMLRTPQSLPAATAAQRGDLHDPRTRDLLARQKSLAQKSGKAADIIDQISQKQQSAIASTLKKENKLPGRQILEEITNSIENLKAQRAADYQQAFEEMIAASPNPNINIDNTLSFLNTLEGKAAKGSSLKAALQKARDIITQNADDPERLINAKSAIQDMTEATSGLNLGSKQSKLLQDVARQLNTDIDAALPGYTRMNEQYKTQSDQLNKLVEGIAGKTANKAANKPSDVFEAIFEKTDPALIGELKQVIPENIYKQAADQYFANLMERGLETTTKNQINKTPQYQKIGDILEKNLSTLKQTLPESHASQLEGLIKDIKQNALGVPSGEFTIDARPGVNIGDEVESLGKTNLVDLFKKVPKALGADKVKENLAINEMLTGVSPLEQIRVSGGEAGARALQKKLTANSINAPQDTPPGGMQSQEMLPMATGDINTEPESTLDPFDSLINEFTARIPKDKMGDAPEANQEGSSIDPFDALIEEFKKGSSASLDMQSLGKQEMLSQLKQIAEATYPDNPVMQRVALSQAILESGLTGKPSELATKHNNLFGIKQSKRFPGTAGNVSMATNEFMDGGNRQMDAAFAANLTPHDSFNQHKALMTQASRYEPVINSQNPADAFMALQKAGYATDPAYARKLAQVYMNNVEPLYSGI